MRRLLTALLVVSAACVFSAANAAAQSSSPFLFTVTTPGTAGAAGGLDAMPGERALSVWDSPTIDPGTGLSAWINRRVLVRASRSTTDLVVAGHSVGSFDQLEVLGSLVAHPGLSIAAGGGVRTEWAGADTLVGRVVAGAALAGGRLEGNLVLEKAVGTPGPDASMRRDAADVIVTAGWSHPVNELIALGVETIGQDLEGFWNPFETEGGARLWVGPSVHVAPRAGHWALRLTGGPLVRSTTSLAESTAPRIVPATSSRSHYAIVGTFSYVLH